MIYVYLINLFCIVSFVLSFQKIFRYGRTNTKSIHLKIQNSLLNDQKQFQSLQWLLLQLQLGNFTGVQTGYDPDNEEVADYMYTQSNMAIDNYTITHINSIVAQEIRSDCETCFDSERIKSKIIGRYTPETIRTRLCENAELRGPGLTPRGISTEISIRDGDARIRVLFAYEPFFFKDNNEVMDTPAFKFSDYVIVRERISKRPLNKPDNPDSLWYPTSINMFNGLFSGSRHYFLNGKPLNETITNFSLLSISDSPVLPSESSHFYFSHQDIDNNLINFKRALPGGILIQSPMIVDPSDQARCRVTWFPAIQDNFNTSIVDNFTTNPREGYSAEIIFRMPSGERTTDGRPQPPSLISFILDKLKK
jgi:hypothetical protein